MSEFPAELEEILALTASPYVDGNRTLAYSKLLCLQGRSSDNPSSIRALGESCGSILPYLVSDISDEDEEIAALALKCLGFMIYHPMIVAAITGNVAGEVLASIAEVARTTKMKLVCNLGVWCISMQQLDEETIRCHFQLLVKAVVHAIDNPFGSLSTTFEAFQAVIKLVGQADRMMRESSDFWLPPTYRRLLSDDKRARDMADRCLLKIKPTVMPPTLVLFKAVHIDLKASSLLKMKEMIKDGYKIQAVQAWGWVIRLLGNYATKDRHLFNDMLKVLESAFLDSDPQVQIASQVAWQGLVEAVILPLVTGKEKDMGKQTPGKEKFALDESQINGLLKILKLIMTPIVGIVSSQCNLAVRSACFDTWCIVLHKLHSLVNHQAIRTVVLKPVFEVVFRKKEESVRNGSWDLCVDMLVHSMLPPEGRRKTLASDNVILDSLEHVMFSRPTWRQYPIKLPTFDYSQFDFYLEVIGMIIGVPQATVIGGHKDVECAAAVRIMRSLMQVIQMDLKTSSAKYDDIMASVKSILSFVKHISEDRVSNETRQMVLHFIRTISQELEPSFLVSPLYKVTLDVKYMDQLNLVEDARHAKKRPIHSFSFGDMVCPMVYLVILYFNVLFQLNQSISDAKSLEEDVSKFVRIILSGGWSENLATVTMFFYRYLDLACVNLWKAVALGLRDILDGQNSSLSVQLVSACQSSIALFLTYPVQAIAFHTNNVESHKDALKEFLPSIIKDLDQNNIGSVWVSLFASISKADIEDSFGNSCTNNILCWTLNGFLQRNVVRLVVAESNSNLVTHILSLFGIMLTSVLESILTKEVYANGRPIWTGGVLPVMLRFMKLLMADAAAVCPNLQDLNSRVLDALGRVAQRINSKQDVLLFIEIFSDPLAVWLSQTKSSWSDCILQKLERLSVEALRCSTRSQPAIEFDSSLIKVQARLLEQTLGHSKQSISDPAIGLWNTTYGGQTNLDYPKTLLPILDSLWRSNKIYLGNVRALMMTRNGTSKRVELASPNHSSKQMVRKKRKGTELTEHNRTWISPPWEDEDSQEAGTSG